MALVGEIRRILYLKDMEEANQILDGTIFWYHPDMSKTGQVFWTENHAMMNMSSELLLLEFTGRTVPDGLRRRLEFFLRFKSIHGLSEFMSPVYLPFTISALLNLYDYARDGNIREWANQILNTIAGYLFVVSLDDASFITPCGRTYERYRTKCTGLHLNTFVHYIRHHKVIGDPTQALYKTLTTTTFRFDPQYIPHLKDPIHLSPSYDTVMDSVDDLGDDMLLTMLWSHGIWIPRNKPFIARILRFMDQMHLWDHPHFAALSTIRRLISCIPISSISAIISCIGYSPCIRPYIKGAYLTDAKMVVYKEGEVVLSSLTYEYNAGLPCYQQWPWAIDLAGIPIWCSYGSVGTGGIGCLNPQSSNETSSSRVMPRMLQNNNVLIASYKPAYCLLMRPRLEMRWPLADFDEHGVYDQWTWARRFDACVAYKTPHNDMIIVIVWDARRNTIENVVRSYYNAEK